MVKLNNSPSLTPHLSRDFNMNTTEKTVSYVSTNSYSTLNKLGNKTKNVWVVLHGIGYLSRYFLKYFDDLPKDENYIIAPQAPSKYYLNSKYRHVGASWLTKEETARETKNVIAYLDSVLHQERIPENCNLIIFGFSQGVSIASRWVAQKKLKCKQLVLYAGGLPNELKKCDFEFLQKNNTKVTLLVGDKDEFINVDRLKAEEEKMNELFGDSVEQIIFEGKHEVKKELINKLVE
ncbi:putative esterase [Flavobacteriaceae bacterium MAR_2009_75]|nr:putative esterase [Flavobacteriaceae bacterium MAR_2009_75]